MAFSNKSKKKASRKDKKQAKMNIITNFSR